MYEEFFNLKTKPFELSPNPDFLFMSRSHKRAMTHLDYGIKERIGFILLTGEVGSGKTTIIRDQIKRLNGRAIVSKIFNTMVTAEQLISMINEDFGLNVAGKDKITLLRELNDFLIGQYAGNRQPILIIDEAQNFTAELLEEVRMLSNLETDRCKLLQIILVGQPELRRIIARPELRQLRQRISISFHISPLRKDEMKEYILHRLDVAGNVEAVAFAEEAFDIIFDFSRGIPRLVNIICDFLLLSAFVEGTREISVDLVREVIGELEMEHKYWQDELPESFGAGTGNESWTKYINELVMRTAKLEDDFAASFTSRYEKADILRRLSSMERMLTDRTASPRVDISALQSSVDNALIELGKVRDLINELEKRLPKQVYTREKGFWKRLFS
jgi:general secretion pathway protein A